MLALLELYFGSFWVEPTHVWAYFRVVGPSFVFIYMRKQIESEIV